MTSQAGIQTTASSRFTQLGSLPVARAVSFALLMEIFFLIAIGGLVRNSGAGLACPDWPLCYGKVIPPMNYQIFLEWFHRLMAGTVSAALLALTLIVTARKELRVSFLKYCIAALCLVLAQSVLGGLTVLGLLSPKWVSSHLAVALLFFGSILWLTLKLRDFDDGDEPAKATETRGLARLTLVVAGVVYVQAILGALVSSNYAGLVCPDFPTCNGSLIPPFEGLVRFQFMHRLGAVVSSIAVIGVCVAAIGKTLSRRARSAFRILPMLLVLQIFLGVGSVLYNLPLLMSVAHLGTAAALFGMLLVATYEVRRSY